MYRIIPMVTDYKAEFKSLSSVDFSERQGQWGQSAYILSDSKPPNVEIPKSLHILGFALTRIIKATSADTSFTRNVNTEAVRTMDSCNHGLRNI